MDQEQRKQLGDRIRETRRTRGWSQAKLALEAGVAENTVVSIELAKKSPQDAKIRAILDALGMVAPADDVLDLEGVPEDVRIFLKVAAQRLKVMGADERARLLADIYPKMFGNGLALPRT